MRGELFQPSLDIQPDLPADAYRYGERASGEVHGVVLTKPHVVSLILDLSGYTEDRDLTAVTLLEPSCGHGAFVVPAAERLLTAATRLGIEASRLAPAIRAFDIDAKHVESTRAALVEMFVRHSVSRVVGMELAEQWVVQGDFLLHGTPQRFDVIVGNPPYVRIEQLSPQLQTEYRRRYRSLYDRADLYVAFIERSLQLLSDSGCLSFICADRWTVNKYGAPLREIVSGGFSVQFYVDLHKASPFESEVIAYPSIFVIRRGHVSCVKACALETASEVECATAFGALTASSHDGSIQVAMYDSWFEGREPWIVNSPSHLRVLRELEARFEPLELSGRTRVGIGVATGDDSTFIVSGDADIEPDRLVPLVMRADIENGTIRNAGRFVINTFEGGQGVIDLNCYPRLSRYLTTRESGIRRRHVAQKNPSGWFRTIDRVYPELVKTPKLLIPDIAGSNEVVFEPGAFHPHHNLYFVTSSDWDLEVLGGLLSSRVALFFVWSYAVKMRGGYLRFQAQYLRRIRAPQPEQLSQVLQQKLREAFRERDFSRLDALALEAYSLPDLPSFDFVDTRR